MKNTIYYIVILICVIFLMQGCSKDQSSFVSDQIIEDQSDTQRAPDLRKLHFSYVYTPWGELADIIYWGCAWPSENCLPTVVIRPKDERSSETEILEAYKSFIESYNNDNLCMFFKGSQYIHLFPEVAQMTEVLDDIINNKLTFYHNVGEDGFDYYVGLSNEIEYLSEWGGNEKVVLVVNNQQNN